MWMRLVSMSCASSNSRPQQCGRGATFCSARWFDNNLIRTYLKIAALADTALKTNSKCSFTTCKLGSGSCFALPPASMQSSAFSFIFALSHLRSRHFETGSSKSLAIFLKQIRRHRLGFPGYHCNIIKRITGNR